MEGRICPYCSKPVKEHEGFCPHCGKKLSGDADLEKEATIQASADPGTIMKAMRKKPEIEKQLGVKAKEGDPVQIDFREKEKEKTAEKAKEAGKTEETELEEVPQDELDEEDSLEITAKLEQIAQYGPLPTRWWESVPYFLRVLSRKRELKDEIKRISDVCIKKQNERDAELLVLGHLKVQQADVRQEHREQMEALDRAKADLEAAGKEKSTEEREIEEKEAYLNEDISRLQEEKNNLIREQQILENERRHSSRELRQAGAKIKKADIETEKIRKLLAQQDKGTASDMALTEKYNFQIRELEEIKARESEKHRSAQNAVEELDRKLALVADKQKQTEAKIDQADQRKSQVIVSLKERSDRVARKFHQLHNEYNKCLRDVAMAAFKKSDIPSEFAQRKQGLIDRMMAADEADQMLEKYLLALESYDVKSCKRGKTLLGVGVGAAALLAAGIIIGLIYAVSSAF